MEIQLRLKSDSLKGAQPFAIDFGGSVLKLVYLCKDPEDEGYTLVKCRRFARADVQKALDFIKTEVDVPSPCADGEPPALVMTGVGMHEYSQTIQSQLNFRPVSTWEAQCNVRAALFLMNHLDDEQLYHPATVTRDASWQQFADDFAEFLKAAGNDPPNPDTVVRHVPQRWPLMLVVLGSAFSFRLVDQTGKSRDVHFSPRGGRNFFGLGSLLTGAKNFEELMELARAGDDRPIHTYTSDLLKQFQSKDSDDTAYNKMKMDANVFSYGWAPGKTISDYKREDLARAALYSLVQELVQDLMQVCAWKQVTNVMMFGGFLDDPLVRHLLENEIYKAQAAVAFTEPGSAAENATFRMPIAGSYLGAIGALLQSIPDMD